MSMEKNLIVEALKRGEHRVRFKKVDGTERVMRCTLDPSLFSPPAKKTDRVATVSDGVVSAWDLDKSAWRSFKVDSVLDFEGL